MGPWRLDDWPQLKASTEHRKMAPMTLGAGEFRSIQPMLNMVSQAGFPRDWGTETRVQEVYWELRSGSTPVGSEGSRAGEGEG